MLKTPPGRLQYTGKRKSRTYFSSQAVETAHLQISGLPPKPKTRFELLEVVVYLRPDIIDAFEKNYTQEEVTVILRNAGIVAKDQNLNHFWRLFHAEEKNLKSKKNALLKTSAKGTSDVPGSVDDVIEKRKAHKKAPTETQKNIRDELQKEDITALPKASLDIYDMENMTKNNSKETPYDASPSHHDEPHGTMNGAHFELQPDTDDI